MKTATSLVLLLACSVLQAIFPPLAAHGATARLQVSSALALPGITLLGALRDKKLSILYLVPPHGCSRLIRDDDRILFLSRDRQTGTITDLDSGRVVVSSPLLIGSNLKSVQVVPNGWLVAVDHAPDSGNTLFGIFHLSPDGTFRQLNLSHDYHGLGDLIRARDRGWLFLDFEANNIYHLPAEGIAETPLLTKAKGTIPVGLYRMTHDSKGELYVIERRGAWPFAPVSRLYRIAGAKAVPIVDGRQFSGLAWNRDNLLPKGLYFSDAEEGVIYRLANGKKVPVVKGLEQPGDILFDDNGSLLVVCAGRIILRFGKNGGLAPQTMLPFREGVTSIPEPPLADLVIKLGGRTFITDSRGQATLDGLAAGTYPLTIALPGYQALHREIRINGSRKMQQVTLLRTGSSTLMGLVQVADKVPVAGARITLVSDDEKLAANPPLSLAADFSGSFTVPDLPWGRYTVRVTAPGCRPLEQAVDWPQPDNRLLLTLEPEVRQCQEVHLAVTDARSGQPVAGAEVVLSEAAATTVLRTGRTNRAGRLRLDKLALGMCNLAVHRPPHLVSNPLQITVTARGYFPQLLSFTAGDTPLKVALFPETVIDEQEPNDQPATAQPIFPNATIRTTVARNNDRDLFRFRLARRARVLVETGAKPPIETSLQLLDKNGRKLKMTNAYIGQQNRLDAGSLMPGTYSVQLEEWGNNSASPDPVMLKVRSQVTEDGREPNDTPEQARLLTFNQKVRGTIVPRGDQDWFRFSVQRPGRLQIRMEASEGQRAVFLYHRGDKKKLVERGVYSRQPLQIQSDLVPGDYLLCVREWGDNAEVRSPWSLQLSYINDDGIDDPPPGADGIRTVRTLAPNGTAASTIWPLHDRDRYSITLTGAGRLVLTGKAPFQLHLRLLDSKGELLAEQGRYENQINTITHDANGPEKLVLEVLEWGDNAASPALYFLRSKWFPADNNDQRHRNDEITTATSIRPGTTIRNTILPLKDHDWYRIKVDHPGFLRVQGSAPGQLEVSWLDSRGRQLVSRGFYSNTPIDVAVPVVEGTYFLSLREWGDNAVILQPYTLTISHERAEPGEKTFAETDPPRPLVWGQGRSFVLDCDKDVDRFSIDVKRPGKLVISLCASTAPEITVYGRDRKKPLFKRGGYANSTITIPLEIKRKERLLIQVNTWGRKDHDPAPGYIVVDDTSHKIIPAQVTAEACGGPATACFTLQVKDEKKRLAAAVDTDGDGTFELALSATDSVEQTFARPGVYPVQARITEPDGLVLLQQLWVDVSDSGEQQEIDLSVEGINDGAILEKEQRLTIYATPSSGARMKTIRCFLDNSPLTVLTGPPCCLELPWSRLGRGHHLLRVVGEDSHGHTKTITIGFRLSGYFGLVPENGAALTGEHVRISWIGDEFGPAVVRYRQVGRKHWQTVTGESGRHRSVLLSGLTPGSWYEYQVIGGQRPSLPRKFHLLKGLSFGQPTYGANIDRDYNQKIGISVRNNGDKTLMVRLVCGKPADPLLLVGFVGAGSEDRPFPLKPGEERQFMLGLSAQDVLTAHHSFPIRIISSNGLSDQALVNVNVRLPQIKLAWEEIGPVTYGLGKRYRLINRGDTITDLAVTSARDDVSIVPAITHGLLPAGDSVEMTIYPRLHQGFQRLSTRITARGLNKEFPLNFQVQVPQGKRIFSLYLVPGVNPAVEPERYRECVRRAMDIHTLDPDTVDWGQRQLSEDLDMDGKADRWFIRDPSADILWVGDDTDGDDRIDFVHADRGMDGIYEYSALRTKNGWQETNLVEAWLEMGFTLPWSRSSYHPHDVDIVFNDTVIGRLRNTIPNGNYTFRIPPRLIRYNDKGQPEGNGIGIRSRHLRGGHYVVNSDFRFTYRLTTTPVWSIGSDREDAYRRALKIDGMSLNAPDYSVSSSAMAIKGPELLTPGLEVTVQTMIRNMGARSTPAVTVALFDQRSGQGKMEVSRVELDDVPVNGVVPVTLPWKTSGGSHQLTVVIDPEGEGGDDNRSNNEASLFVTVPGDDEPPRVRITTPADGSVLHQAVTSIRVLAEDEAGIDRIMASVDGGLRNSLRRQAEGEYRGYLLLQPGKHTIRVTGVDSSGNEKTVPVHLTVHAEHSGATIVFPRAGQDLLSRTCPVVLKTPADTILAAARVNGGPWYRASMAGGFARVTVPLRFGTQPVEVMAVGKNGIVTTGTVTINCTRQPKKNMPEEITIPGDNSGLVYLPVLRDKIDFFKGWNQVVAKPGE